MKKIYLLTLCLLLSIGINAQQYELREIVDGEYNSQGIKSMVSSFDGLHYYQMNDENSALIKFEYATGNVSDTLFSTK
ncbi:MAG TPA: hypothetical protein VJY12_09890, partial [Dysgonamonadaceae bacterium]|nr:hypothetical protein [Dysgonamonadaceae bacterium]